MPQMAQDSRGYIDRTSQAMLKIEDFNASQKGFGTS